MLRWGAQPSLCRTSEVLVHLGPGWHGQRPLQPWQQGQKRRDSRERWIPSSMFLFSIESFSFWCQPTAYVLGLTLFLALLQVTEHILQSNGQSSQATLSPLPGGCQAGKDARETTGARSEEECSTTAIISRIPRWLGGLCQAAELRHVLPRQFWMGALLGSVANVSISGPCIDLFLGRRGLKQCEMW